MNAPEPARIDRRVAITWMLTASAGAVLMRGWRLGAAPSAEGAARTPAKGRGYGTDPDLMREYKPGDYWALTFTDAERRAAAALGDIVIPADSRSPSASSLGIVDFLDEWVSAPYPDNVSDAGIVRPGLAWLDAESARRFGAPFAAASAAERESLCGEISRPAPAGSESAAAHPFFRLFRDLVATGYYTTPVGMKDIGYAGNVPSAKFDGPPADLVARLGLSDEVKA